MKLNDITKQLELENLTPELRAAELIDVSGGHASDLLSDVLANAPKDGVLVTIQAHINVVAVSVHAGLAAVIFASGKLPGESVRQKAIEEGVRLYSSKEPTFNIVGRLYALGLRGSHA